MDRKQLSASLIQIFLILNNWTEQADVCYWESLKNIEIETDAYYLPKSEWSKSRLSGKLLCRTTLCYV